MIIVYFLFSEDYWSFRLTLPGIFQSYTKDGGNKLLRNDRNCKPVQAA